MGGSLIHSNQSVPQEPTGAKVFPSRATRNENVRGANATSDERQQGSYFMADLAERRSHLNFIHFDFFVLRVLQIVFIKKKKSEFSKLNFV